MASFKGLHPIYTALDNHQYSRAIKLCLALPTTNTLSRALLAHAYGKSGQRYKSLICIRDIFGGDCGIFPELQREIQYAGIAEDAPTPAGSSGPPAAASKKPSKKGQKGKRKGAQTQSFVPVTQPTPQGTTQVELIDQLENPPTLPDDWNERIPAASALVPEVTLLATLSMTMGSVLKLPLTAYQLYCWALSFETADVLMYARKAYLHGVSLLMSPQYEHIHASLLSNMQVFALQIARLQPASTDPSMCWAAQTALWQLTLCPQKEERTNSEKIQQRLRMLPRLAESLAQKCVATYSTISKHSKGKNYGNLLQTESFLLYTRTLTDQSKWSQLHTVVTQRMKTSEDSGKGSPPEQVLLELQARALINMEGRSADAEKVTKSLVLMFPDDWEYWLQYVQCCIAIADGDVLQGCASAKSLVSEALDAETTRHPLRGPNLLQVELAWQIANFSQSAEHMDDVLKCIIVYGNKFSAHASCTFSDLSPYLNLCLKQLSNEQVLIILNWSAKLREVTFTIEDDTVKRRQLRVYTFALQLNFQVVSLCPTLSENLPSWQEIMTVWQMFQEFDNRANVDQAQKESRPADELVLLAVQRLLHKKPSTSDKVLALCLLESAMNYSPHNAYIRICSLSLFAELDAVSRCWHLYNDLDIKHIQHESCSYLILKILRSGGFYLETINVCQGILGMQNSSNRESVDYASRALENGALSKSDEFIRFRLEKMNKSLTTAEAKGLLLNAAPLVTDEKGELGVSHGVCGGDMDFARTRRMISELNNPNGAFSLFGLAKTSECKLSDNRDFDILSYEILCRSDVASSESIWEESLGRAHLYGLLIRAALCRDGTRGPKKGKISKTLPHTEKRCKSLAAAMKDAAFLEKDPVNVAYGEFFHVVLGCCRVILLLSAGIDSEGKEVHFDLEAREEAVAISLSNARKSLESAHCNLRESGPFTISGISCLLFDRLSAIFAVFRMCADLMDLFGWGKRKGKTKRCSAEMAGLALSLTALLKDMKEFLNDCSTDAWLNVDVVAMTSCTELVDAGHITEVCAAINNSRRESIDRLDPIISSALSRFETFQLED